MSELRDLVVSIDFDDIDVKKLLKIDDAMNEIEDQFGIMDDNIDGATREFKDMSRGGTRAMDEIEDSTDDVNDAMRDFNDGINDGQSLFGGLKKVALGVAAAITAAFVGAVVFSKKAIDEAVAFDTKMREVFTLLPGISNDAMKDMKDDVKDFSKEFGVLPDQVVPALYSSLSAGVPKDNVFDFMGTAQKAAVGGVTELETAVDGITSVVNAFGSDVIDAGRASDLMFTAVKGGKTTFEELSANMSTVAPLAAGLGVDFGDVTAALATMTAQGEPTNSAATKIRGAMDEMAKEGTKAAGVFEEMTGKTFKEFISEGGNLQTALQEMEKGAEEAGVGINDLFGSSEAGMAALMLTGKGTEKFTSDMEAMQDSAGATEDAFQTMQGPEENFKKWEANLAVLRLEWGEKLLPIVNEFIEVVVDKFPAIAEKIEDGMDKGMEFYELFRDNWPLIKDTVIGLGVAVGSFALIMGGLKVMSVINALMIAYRAGTVAATLAQMGLNTAMLLNPITWVVALIAGMIAIGVLLYRNWDTVKEKAGELWDWLSEAFGGIKDAVTEKLQPVMDFFNGLMDKWEDFKSSIGGFKMPKIGMPKWMGGNGVIQTDGSHETGLARVPYDGYVGELHKDEAVLTATQSNALRQAGILSGDNKPTVQMQQQPQEGSTNNIARTTNNERTNNTFSPHIEIKVEGGKDGQVDHGEIAQTVKNEMEKFWIQMQLQAG